MGHDLATEMNAMEKYGQFAAKKNNVHYRNSEHWLQSNDNLVASVCPSSQFAHNQI